MMSLDSTIRASAQPRPDRRAQAATLIGTSLGFGVIQLDVTVVNVAVKQIGAAFGGGIAELQWVVSSYTLMFAALILAAGALGDRFGARRVLYAGFVIFVAASMACGLAPGIAALIAARAVQGIGAALLGSCSLALLSRTFTDPRRRARAIGQWAAGASAALSGGPVVGGLLIASLGWRSIFFINAPVGLTGLWLVWRHAPRTPPAPERRVDLPGAVTAVVALAAFAAAVIETGQQGFTSPWVLAGLTASALAVAGQRGDRRARHDPRGPGRHGRRLRGAAVGRPSRRLPGPAGAADPARRRPRTARPADDRPRAVQCRTLALRCRLGRADRLQAGGQPARRRPVRRPGREPLLPRPAHRPVDQHRGPRTQRCRPRSSTRSEPTWRTSVNAPEARARW
jgi:hypothetical protein